MEKSFQKGIANLQKAVYDDQLAKTYHLRRFANATEKYQFEHWDPIIKKVLYSYSEGKKCLDNGCGTGTYLECVQARASLVIGVDISMNMLKYALQNDSLLLVNASADFLPFESGIFDMVYSIGMMEYVNVPVVLKEMFRVTRDQGLMILLTPNKYGGRKFFSHGIKKLKGRTGTANYYSRNEMIGMLHLAGFKTEKIIMTDGLVYIPGQIEKWIGMAVFNCIERFFRIFPYNPWSQNMLFIVKKD